MKKIEKRNGEVSAVIEINKYGAELITCRDGYRSTGQQITPELARLTIAALEEYLSQ